MGVTVDELDYEVKLGPAHHNVVTSRFKLDPDVKSETILQKDTRKDVDIMRRGISTCTIRDSAGNRCDYLMRLRSSESALSQISDPQRFPHITLLRNKMLVWRFYHSFRTDADSPLRRPQVGVRTFSLAPDGADLAAALQTIRENGDDGGLAAAVEDAFPGSELVILGETSELEVGLQLAELSRPLRAAELSDGTLRYLALLAALKSPVPPPLMAINEPESSLNPDLLLPLARLIASVAGTTQLWITTHSKLLADAICDLTSAKLIELEKVDGETVRKGRPRNAAFSAEWDL